MRLIRSLRWIRWSFPSALAHAGGLPGIVQPTIHAADSDYTPIRAGYCLVCDAFNYVRGADPPQDWHCKHCRCATCRGVRLP
jgi:hypothetical protein